MFCEESVRPLARIVRKIVTGLRIDDRELRLGTVQASVSVKSKGMADAEHPYRSAIRGMYLADDQLRRSPPWYARSVGYHQVCRHAITRIRSIGYLIESPAVLLLAGLSPGFQRHMSFGR